MRPIQFSQDKLKWEWKYLNASPNTSEILYKVRQAKAKRPIQSSPKTVKKTVATLLTEYYSILFNPTYRNYFRPLTDLTLLFPTNESISISNDTNFILLPLPLPTYRNHTQAMHNDKLYRLNHPCPFIKHISTANELVHDMDYRQDNRRVMRQRVPQECNKILHTNPEVKRERLEQPLDITARIRVYKFDDLPPELARTIPGFPRYSLSESPTRPGYTLCRQYTFLEITPASVINASCNNKLQVLSKYLEPSQLSTNFADCFDFVSPSKESIIEFFMDNMDWIEYSPTQIKSGIKRLKNIIKYMKPKDTPTNPIRRTEESEPEWYESYKVKFNQYIHTLNIKQPDWTYSTQVIEDTKIINKTSANNIKPLSVNDLPQWLSQQ